MKGQNMIFYAQRGFLFSQKDLDDLKDFQNNYIPYFFI